MVLQEGQGGLEKELQPNSVSPSGGCPVLVFADSLVRWDTIVPFYSPWSLVLHL